MEIDPDRATAHYAKLTLESACSVVDLLVAVQDVVTILKKLFLEHQILHKHIEYNNISIRNDNGIQGVVIDLDFPDLIEASRSTEEFGLCGTLAFQSLNRLGSRFSSDKQHTIQDSLESVFYVLCWACYGYSHDGRPDKFRPNWMGRWTETQRCQRDILESVIEKIRRKIERQLPNDPEACDAILDILTGGSRRREKNGVAWRRNARRPCDLRMGLPRRKKGCVKLTERSVVEFVRS
ncbi:hypothetical protein B0H14DRAFT_2761211 [Mycena olivaceomarginata]|nr:hypothetical protein B0H14DRAFT_2761211 [Mycena olivaceomarginata]